MADTRYISQFTDRLGTDWRSRITSQGWGDALTDSWLNISATELNTDGIDITYCDADANDIIITLPPFTVAEGQSFDIDINFNLIDGDAPTIGLGLGGNWISNMVVLSPGANSYKLTATQDTEEAVIVIRALAGAVEFSVTGFNIARSAIELQATDTPLIWEGYPEDDPFNRAINGHRAVLNIWVDGLNLTPLFTANDFEFPLVIEYRQPGEDWQLYWQGYVLASSYNEPYDMDPVSAQIVAVDGLGLLRNIQFNDLDIDGYNYLSDYIFQFLELIGFTEYDEFVNIYGDGMGSEVDQSPLNQLGASHFRFADLDVYDSLTIILNAFNAVIEIIDGRAIIYRLQELKNPILYGRRFTSGTGHISITRESEVIIQRGGNLTGVRDVEGGNFMALPRAKHLTLEYKKGWQESALRQWRFEFDDFTPNIGDNWFLTKWPATNIKPRPLSRETAVNADRGVYLRKLSTNLYGNISQELTGVRTRDANLNLSFRYAIHNTHDSAASYRLGTRISITPPGSPHLTRYYQNTIDALPGQNEGWRQTNPDVYSIYKIEPPTHINLLPWWPEEAAQGWGRWQEININIKSIPFDGTLKIELMGNILDHHNHIRIAYQDVKLQFRPESGPADLPTIREVDNGGYGEDVTRELLLSDGPTLARLTVNQLFAYSGVLCLFDGDIPINPPKSWHTRGQEQDKELSDLIAHEIAEQREHHRFHLDLPVFVDRPDIFLKPAQHIVDPLINRDGEPVRFKLSIKEFNPRDRDYKLSLTEIMGPLMPTPPDPAMWVKLNNASTNQTDYINHEGGVIDIDVETKDPAGWDTSLTDPDSAVVSYTDSGPQGLSNAGVTLSESTEETSRTVEIVYFPDSEPSHSLKLTITQGAAPSGDFIKINDSTDDYYAYGLLNSAGAVGVTVDASDDWSATVIDDTDNMISGISPSSGAEGDTSVDINYNANSGENERYAVVTFELDNGAVPPSISVFICQEGMIGVCP